MPNGFGRGKGFGRGFGRGMGFGFRGASPPWPYVGIGRGGLPRCGYFVSDAGIPQPWLYQHPYYGHDIAPSFPSQATRQDELDYLKGLARTMSDDLKEIETRIQEIESESSEEES
ncbi:MAG TPA: DUF5320 family protein [Dehalococcoidia bacterium]|nr:DUF5320 family protein [Dehalococcoidia bacterium]